MAKKREWKAWMVVDKRGKPKEDSLGYYLFSSADSAGTSLRAKERIIRVRIVEA